MKKLFVILITLIFLSLLILIIYFISKNITPKDYLKEITIASYAEKYDLSNEFSYGSGNRFKDTNGKVYQLAGIVVPMYYPNALPQYMDKIKKELIGKTVWIKIIEEAKPHYPKFPLVLIYFDPNNKISFNEKWLKKGNAFFDYGYYKDKEVFQEAENYAREHILGIWNEIDKLKILYIGSKNWKFFYKPNDSKVKEIKEKNRVYYYIIPPPIFDYKGYMPIGREKKDW